MRCSNAWILYDEISNSVVSRNEQHMIQVGTWNTLLLSTQQCIPACNLRFRLILASGLDIGTQLVRVIVQRPAHARLLVDCRQERTACLILRSIVEAMLYFVAQHEGHVLRVVLALRIGG